MKALDRSVIFTAGAVLGGTFVFFLQSQIFLLNRSSPATVIL
jgi:hypothetical protein